MLKIPARAALSGLLILISGCAPPIGEALVRSGPVCAYRDLVLSGDFPGGRLTECTRTGRRSYRLRFAPEAPRINPSPWYAFRIESHKPQRLMLTLEYDGYKHRYVPKVNRGDGWRPHGAQVALSDDERRGSFRLAVREGRTEIAAQPLVMPEDTARWLEEVAAASPQVVSDVLGSSAEGRPVRFLRSGDTALPAIVILGRQHPPEVPGDFALKTFVDRLLADDWLAERFRSAFGLFVIPMLNPDGVVRGNWRLDSARTDLNRDWGPFERPETRLVRDALHRLAHKEGGLILALDFHATHRDILYTQPDDADGAFKWFPAAWHAAINRRLPGAPVERIDAHNADKPTFKTWVHTAYTIPGMTVEFGDETSQSRIGRVAAIAAEEMMRLLLERAGAAGSTRREMKPL